LYRFFYKFASKSLNKQLFFPKIMLFVLKIAIFTRFWRDSCIVNAMNDF